MSPSCVLLQCTAVSSLPSHTTSGDHLQHYITGTVLSSSNLKSGKTHKTGIQCIRPSTAALYWSNPFGQNAFSQMPPRTRLTYLPIFSAHSTWHSPSPEPIYNPPLPESLSYKPVTMLRIANKIMACGWPGAVGVTEGDCEPGGSHSSSPFLD